ncbi:MAG: hypothetical protein ABII09_03595 [Planctomycetota bacterium]
MKRLTFIAALLLTVGAVFSAEIQFNYDSGETLYFTRFSPAGYVFLTDGSAFEEWVAADSYDVNMAEVGLSGRYGGDWDKSGNIGSGRYSFVIYSQAGGSPANDDTKIGIGEINWSGTAEQFGPTKAEMDEAFDTADGNLVNYLAPIDLRVADNTIAIAAARNTLLADGSLADANRVVADAALTTLVGDANGNIIAEFTALATVSDFADAILVDGTTNKLKVNTNNTAEINDVAILAAVAAIETAALDANDLNGVFVNLLPTGLDLIPTTDPNGLADTWPEMVVQLWRIDFKKLVRTSSLIYLYNEAGTPETQQEWSDDGTYQIMQDAENYSP